jgi:hypothetical protein
MSGFTSRYFPVSERYAIVFGDICTGILTLDRESDAGPFEQKHNGILMPERKVQLPIGNTVLSGSDVPITKKTEGLYEYELEDGSIIRVGLVVTQVIRVDGSFDGDGNPVYIVRNGIVTNTIQGGEKVRRPK